MVKRLEQRLEKNNLYKTLIGRPLTDFEIERLYDFHSKIGFTSDRIKTIIQFIKLGYVDWVEIWDKLKSLHNGKLEFQILLYGKIAGEARFIDINKRKTRGFDHSSDAQRKKALKSAILSRGRKDYSVRSLGYWIKKGFSEEDSRKKVSEVQATNSLNRYIKKYGEIEGERRFNERKNTWASIMKSPEISKRKSLGLWRYIERYGDVEGRKKYLDMRRRRNAKCSIGFASKESLKSLSEIIHLLDEYNIGYYLGVPGNKEWFIYDINSKKMFFYDLTIPSIGLIIEYHGEAFHPNPSWNLERLTEWRQLRTGKSSKEILDFTSLKNRVARENGWVVFEVFSSEIPDKIPRLKELIFKLIHS